MRNVLTIFRRELAAYFATPLAYVFIVIFLVMAGILTFFVGNFYTSRVVLIALHRMLSAIRLPVVGRKSASAFRHKPRFVSLW